MEYEFDPVKDARNIAERGLSLISAPLVFADLVAIMDDDRRDYGERRQVAFGRIDGRLFVCVFTDRRDVRRIISLRKANSRERQVYDPQDHS